MWEEVVVLDRCKEFFRENGVVFLKKSGRSFFLEWEGLFEEIKRESFEWVREPFEGIKKRVLRVWDGLFEGIEKESFESVRRGFPFGSMQGVFFRGLLIFVITGLLIHHSINSTSQLVLFDPLILHYTSCTPPSLVYSWSLDESFVFLYAWVFNNSEGLDYFFKWNYYYIGWLDFY